MPSGNRSLLLVEDHPESRRGLAYLLQKHGYKVHEAANGRAALAVARRTRLHAAVLDLKLPDMDGLVTLERILEARPGLPVVVTTGYATVDAAVGAMKRGAVDFLTKPLQVDALLRILEAHIARARASGMVAPSKSELAAEMEEMGMIGTSRPMIELFETIKRVAPHQSTIMLIGESGTGKELVSRALHALGGRASGPFVAVNCATLAEHLLESELFGHEKGSFTSADKPKPGMMQLADGGTLFLDEINEMGLGCQAKLLRALERREFRRVGGTQKIRVDLNVIAATNVDIEACVAQGRFRADLYYRLKVVTLSIPPLRERREAIPVLAQRFLDDVARQTGLGAKQLTTEAMSQLIQYDWPGNIRELRNCMESLTLLVAKAVIEPDDLPPNIRGSRDADVRVRVGMKLEEVEELLIQRTLEHYPTIREAARVLGMGLRTLHTRLQKMGWGRRKKRASGRNGTSRAHPPAR